MRARLIASLVVCAIATLCTTARASAGYPRHEVWLGLGGATSFEKNIFNVSDDIPSKPELAINLGYMFNLNARRAIGLHVYGGTETTPEATLVDASGAVYQTTFDFNTFNIGGRGRYTFSRSTVAPYAIAGLNVANGSIDSQTTGELSYFGVSVLMGGGVGVLLGRRFMLAAEGFGSFGVAKWKNKPFVNSESADFNPSLAGGTLNLSYLWGWR